MKSTSPENGPQTYIRSPNYPLHITQRSNYSQSVFFTDEDRSRFLTLWNHHVDHRRGLVHGHATYGRIRTAGPARGIQFALQLLW